MFAISKAHQKFILEQKQMLIIVIIFKNIIVTESPARKFFIYGCILFFINSNKVSINKTNIQKIKLISKDLHIENLSLYIVQ